MRERIRFAFFVASFAALSKVIDAARFASAPQAIATVDSPLSPPKWARAYSVEFSLSLPQFFLMQPQGLQIPIKVKEALTLRSLSSSCAWM